MNGKMRAPKFDMFAEIRISRAGWKKCRTTPTMAIRSTRLELCRADGAVWLAAEGVRLAVLEPR